MNIELIKDLKTKNFYTYGSNLKSNFLIKNIKQSKEFTDFDLILNLPNKKRVLKKLESLLGLHTLEIQLQLLQLP